MFHTWNTSRNLLRKKDFVTDYVHLSPEACQELVRRQVKLVGIDYLSIDPFDSPTYPAHAILLGAGVLVLEGADLSGVPPGAYTLVCLPLRMAGAEASPVRAVLIAE